MRGRSKCGTVSVGLKPDDISTRLECLGYFSPSF